MLFVERKEGGLRKRLDRHLFGHYMPQLGDGDPLFSTSHFNATQYVLGQDPPGQEREKAASGLLRPLPPVLWRHAHPRAALRPPVALHERHTEDQLEHRLHAQARQRPSHKEFAISLSTTDNDPGSYPTNLKNAINISFFLHDDFRRKWKKFHAVLDVYKLVDSDKEDVRDLHGNECLKDGIKSKYTENLCVPKGYGKLRHLLMVGVKLTTFTRNFTCGCKSSW